MSLLVTGSSSGLGAFLASALKASVYQRNTGEITPAAFEEFQAVIHTAFGMPMQGQAEDAYIAHHVRLAEKLLAIPHKQFIFISSIDALTPTTPYGRAKQAVEALVNQKTRNPLILRPGALLGPGMRISQLLKIARGDDTQLSLSPESTFSLVFYSDMLDIIKTSLNKSITGTYAVLATQPVSLQQVAQHFNHAPQFGTFAYTTPAVTPQNEKWPAIALATQPPLPRLSEFVAKNSWQ